MSGSEEPRTFAEAQEEIEKCRLEANALTLRGMAAGTAGIVLGWLIPAMTTPSENTVKASLGLSILSLFATVGVLVSNDHFRCRCWKVECEIYKKKDDENTLHNIRVDLKKSGHQLQEHSDTLTALQKEYEVLSQKSNATATIGDIAQHRTMQEEIKNIKAEKAEILTAHKKLAWNYAHLSGSKELLQQLQCTVGE
jgi:hypothetical protein